MDAILEEMLKTAPSAVACILIVIIFLRHIDKLNTAFDEGEERRERTLTRSIDRNTEAMNENTRVLGAFNEIKNELLRDRRDKNEE